MKKSKLFVMLPVLVLIFAVGQFGWSASPAPSQAQASTDSAAQAMSSSAASATSKGASANVQEGTKISAQLMSTVDARKVKPGDKVVARVTKNVKQHGHTVIHKGDKLVGHITKVDAGAAANAGSSVAVAFDHLVQGNSSTQLNAVMTSILSVPNSNLEGMEPMPPPMAPVTAASGGSARGGLVSGVGSTVGSAVGATAGVAGSTLGGVSNTVDATTQASLGSNSALNLSTPARQVHLESQASADQSTGMNSVLSTRKGDLRLESGTQMQFRVEGSTQAQ
jgi:hypothetical protein